ncbi:protein phosphatase inhibitor 2-like isoform X2 [Photinus pyralis]|uniref:Protein phosphatase inhibitor 2 n=1 Tax=Photinus pyralis TaxID=7054 RepID=A0A1Y1LLH2_PHOPY|nr:protein phosphatase inhibitor 2-like isoform X2 [Photinus pyralis]
MADNLQKRPSKGILKNSSSFDKQDSRNAKKSKETKWDEMNIIATLHPADKDYGHMKIDEPKTPYYRDEAESEDVLDATELAEKIRLSTGKPPKAMESDDSEDDDEELTPEERIKKKEFESKRKKHYNEYYAVKLARKLLEEEEDEDDDANVAESKSSQGNPSNS